MDPETCARYMKRPLETLLQDSSEEVKSKIAVELKLTLSQMLVDDEQQRHRQLSSLQGPLVDLSKSIGRDWRRDLGLLSAFPRYGNQVQDLF